MSKLPKSMMVKCTISDITLDIPKTVTDDACIRASVFVGRGGKSALTRTTKSFTVVNAEKAKTAVRQVTTGTGEDEVTKDVEFVELKYGSLNDVVYEVEMKPLSVFDGKIVFDKEPRPLTVFAKVLQRIRPGSEGNQAKSVQESNLQEMLDMDNHSDKFSDDGLGSDNESEASAQSGHAADDAEGAGATLTEGQISKAPERDPEEVMFYKLLREIDCKERYLAFPKEIDLSAIANTTERTMTFSERLSTKNIPYMGSMLSFKVTASLPEDVLQQFEKERQQQESKEERALREKEAKLLEKERKKQEKEEEKRAKEERKKQEKNQSKYGADLTNESGAGAGGPTVSSGNAAAEPAQPEKKTFSFLSPFEKIKSVFAPAPKVEQTTPFPLKAESTPFPFLVMLDKFQLKKLYYPPSFYRGVHVRLGTDKVDLDEYPRLMLDTTKKQALVQEDGVRFDGQPCKISSFNFGSSHVYLGDKHIRNVVGFDTIVALQQHEKQYMAKHEAGEPETKNRQMPLQNAELLNVGERFVPVRFESVKRSCNDAQANPTKDSSVVAQLVVPDRIENFVDEKTLEKKWKKAEKARLQKEERERLKEEKRIREEEEAAARKAAEEAGDGSAKEGEDNFESGGADATSPQHEDTKAKASGSSDEEHDNNDDSSDTDSDIIHRNDKPKSGEVTASESSTFVPIKTRPFHLGTYVLNEEYTPKEGIHYYVRFKNGEELHFRARRIYLPSVCVAGVSGALEDATICTFKPNA